MVSSEEPRTDTTPSKHASNLPWEGEEKYHQLFQVSQAGIWVIDSDAYTTVVNPHMAAMLGYAEEEMIGQHLFSFMDEQGIAVATRNIERRKQGIKEQHDFEFLHKDGRRIYTTMETMPLTDEQGNYLGAVAGVLDITERRGAETELAAANEVLRQERSMFTAGPVVVFKWKNEEGCRWSMSRPTWRRSSAIRPTNSCPATWVMQRSYPARISSV